MFGKSYFRSSKKKAIMEQTSTNIDINNMNDKNKCEINLRNLSKDYIETTDSKVNVTEGPLLASNFNSILLRNNESKENKQRLDIENENIPFWILEGKNIKSNNFAYKSNLFLNFNFSFEFS